MVRRLRKHSPGLFKGGTGHVLSFNLGDLGVKTAMHVQRDMRLFNAADVSAVVVGVQAGGSRNSLFLHTMCFTKW